MIPHNRPFLDRSDAKSAAKVLSSGWIAQGKVSEQFEQAAARLLDRRYAKAVSSGTAALHLALLALGISQGDEVILSTYACSALLNAVGYTGASARPADIDELTLGLSVKTIKPRLTSRTKAIIVNHAFGFASDIEGIKKLGVPVIEDCAQSLGSRLNSRPLGSFGDIAICSFYATKMITGGYGGMILTNNRKWNDTIRDLTNYDQRPDYKLRFNYSLSDLNAALGVSQLNKLPEFLKKRRETACRYSAALDGTDLFFWPGRKSEHPNFYRFIAGSLKPYGYYLKTMKSKGIECISPVRPEHLLHRYLRLDREKFPAAETVSRSVFSVPIYPALKEGEIKQIVSALRQLK